MALKVEEWDPSEDIRDEEDAIAYLNAAIEDGDPALIQAVLGDIAKARGMTEIAAKAGLGRESLYKALRPGSQPSLKTISKVARALGARIAFVSVKDNDTKLVA
jgi:probable addiction module antidote protein